MDLLKAEIAKKKRLIEESNVLKEDKKYFKRGDLATAQEEEYWRKHRATKRLKTIAVEAYTSQDSNDSSDDGKRPREDIKKTASRKEVVRRLRERQEPILLFGESEDESYERLKKLEMLMPDLNKGFNNDLKKAMDEVDEDYLKEIVLAGSSSETSSSDVKVQDEGTTLQEILKLAENFKKGDLSLDQEVILKFFKMILARWGAELNSRSEEEKRDIRGKISSATHKQTVEYIKPLFRQLKKRKLTEDILDCLKDVVSHMLNRQYLKANDAYLEMAIGNAPWPIGVTMVGIHARTGREKIFDRNVAHVLNDETQRKFIQAVKRLMTQCQRFFPAEPSQMVNFEGDVH